MSHLRHPVVISSLEEDFRKIGLIKEARREDGNFEEELEEAYREKTMGPKGLPKGQGGETGTGSPGKNTHPEGGPERMRMGYKVGGDKKNKPPKSAGIDHGTEDVDDGWDEEGLAEAYAFAEEFATAWEDMGEGCEVDLDEDDMDLLDTMAEEITTLPVSFLDEEDDEEDDDAIDEGGMYGSRKERGMKYGKKKGKKKGDDMEGSYESVAEALSRIDAIVEETQEQGGATVEQAVPAFANIALIAEMLASFFGSDAFENEGLEEATETYTEMATYAAGIVEFLREEDEDEINMDEVESTMKECVEVLLTGLDVYSQLTEGDEDDDEIDEDDEDDEGND